MGRMFEALKHADAQLDATEAERFALPRAHAPVPVDEHDDLDLISDAPFIEVGPNKSVVTSPGLFDRAPVAPSRVAPRLVDEEPILAPTDEETTAVASEPVLRPMTISFRPAASPPPLGRPSLRPRLAPELIAYHCPEHPASARYAELLTTLSAAAPAGRTPAFFFTSALLGAGTTTVALNLAITAARQGGNRVVVVDANLRRPGVAARLRLAEKPGLREVLCGTLTLEEAIQETEQINLFALTSGSPHCESGPRLVAGTLRSLIRDLRRTFDLVLVDGPRWDGRPEAVAAGVACDAVYLVLPEAEAESPQVDQLVQAIRDQGARLGGCVLFS